MELLYEGKSKCVYASEEGGDTCVMRFKDSLTAGNGVKKAELEGKGKLTAAISNAIFALLEKNGVPTHFIRRIDETHVLVKRVRIVPLEVIVRNRAAGSFSKKYGIKEGAELNNPSVEFSVKNDDLGDPMINASQIQSIGLATREDLDTLIAMALKVNTILTGFFRPRGIVLADFKLEFGRTAEGIVLADEISPDSCRFWDEATSKKLDKDRFRQDLGNILEAYNEIYKRIIA